MRLVRSGKGGLTPLAQVLIAVMVLAVLGVGAFVVYWFWFRVQNQRTRGCRQTSECGDKQVCDIDDKGIGICKDNGCKTDDDAKACNGFCVYGTDNKLTCKCQSDDKDAFVPGTNNKCISECSGTAMAAYKANAMGSADDAPGVEGSFLFCKPRTGTTPAWQTALSSTEAADMTANSLPAYNTDTTLPFDKDHAKRTCTSSLTALDRTLTQCSGANVCVQGVCADPSTAHDMWRKYLPYWIALIVLGSLAVIVFVVQMAMYIRRPARRLPFEPTRLGFAHPATAEPDTASAAGDDYYSQHSEMDADYAG